MYIHVLVLSSLGRVKELESSFEMAGYILILYMCVYELSILSCKRAVGKLVIYIWIVILL